MSLGNQNPSIYDPGLHAQIETAVEAAEALSSIELVVVLAPRSRSYRGEVLATGLVFAAVHLLVLVYVSFVVEVYLALVSVLCVGIFGGVFAHRNDWWIRLISTQAKRAQAVAQLSKVVYFDEAIAGTKDHTGILVFYSHLEQEFAMHADIGVRRKAPEILAHLHKSLTRKVKPWDTRIIDFLGLAGDRLSSVLPVAEDDENEIPNDVKVLGMPL